MAFHMLASTREILDGDVTVFPVASVFYRGVPTVWRLPVTGLEWSSELADQVVRHTATLTVSDDEGRLTPIRSTDPLAPFGAQVKVSVRVAAPGHSADGEVIPVGLMLIVASEPTGGWRLHRGVIEPTGGLITLSLQDLAQDLVDVETPTMIQPASTSAANLLARVCSGILPINLSGIPSSMPPVDTAMTVPNNRMEALKAIIEGSTVNARVTRSGVLEFFTLPTVVSKTVTLAEGTWINALAKLDRDDISNAVIATSDASENPATGIAYEQTGPFATWGPLGTRITRISSPKYSTTALAAQAAANKLAALKAERAITVEATVPFDPTVDAGDLHRVSLIPGQLDTNARVTRVQWTAGDPAMTLTYSIDRNEVDAWLRPIDWQPE